MVRRPNTRITILLMLAGPLLVSCNIIDELFDGVRQSSYDPAARHVKAGGNPTNDSPKNNTSEETSGASAKISLSVPPVPIVAYGATRNLTVVVKNFGKSSATNVELGSVSEPWSLISNSCGILIPAQFECELIYQFRSPGDGTYEQDIIVSHAGASASATLSVTGVARNIQITPIYPNNGNWNDYIRVTDQSKDLYSQSDTACDGTESLWSGCFHGGEKLMASVSTSHVCSSFTINDSLEAFNWECKRSNGNALFYSKGLKESKSLNDLIDANGWKENHLTISRNNTVVAKSAPSIWWNNPVLSPSSNHFSSDSIVSLNSAGTIYYIASSRATSGYNINANKIGLVIADGAILSYSDNASSNCNISTGESTSPNTKCILAAGSQKFIWIEGNLWCKSGINNANYGLLASSISFSQLRNVATSQCESTGTYLVSSEKNILKGIRSAHDKLSGVHLTSSNYNIVQDITISGVQSNYALKLSNSSENIVTKFLIAGNNSAIGNYAVGLSSSNKNTFAFGTVLNNANGITISGSSSVSFTQVASINNQYGVYVTSSSSGYKFANFAALYNQADGIWLNTNSTNGNFSANILLGGNSGNPCRIDSTLANDPGLQNSTCDLQGSSTATIVNDATSISNTFVGKAVADSINMADNNGSQNFSSINDWLQFENAFRIWGQDGGIFPANDHNNACVSGTCVIWDFRLTLNDPYLRNRSYDFNTQNTAFLKDEACPNAVDGNQAFTDGLSTNNTYLLNAFEILHDGAGDDDGLCESNESCVYQPNIGAYVGEGDFSSNGTCLFSSGTILGVTMHAYPRNGS